MKSILVKVHFLKFHLSHTLPGRKGERIRTKNLVVGRLNECILEAQAWKVHKWGPLYQPSRQVCYSDESSSLGSQMNKKKLHVGEKVFSISADWLLVHNMKENLLNSLHIKGCY